MYMFPSKLFSTEILKTILKMNEVSHLKLYTLLVSFPVSVIKNPLTKAI